MAGKVPFMAMKYSLSVVVAMERRGVVGGAAQDIELPLPLRDTLNAPSRGWVTNKSKALLGGCLGSASVIYHPDSNPSDPRLITQNTVTEYQKSMI